MMRDTEDWPEGQAFDHDMYDGPIADHDGDWIRLADYEKAKARIAELEEELAGYWWYAMSQESLDKGDGWLCPYMSEAKYAGLKLVEAGLAEKHPDKDWYRPIPMEQQND